MLGAPARLPESRMLRTLRIRNVAVVEELAVEACQEAIVLRGGSVIDWRKLDFHALEPAVAYRVLYDEDRVASIRPFDPISQRPADRLFSGAGTPEVASVAAL